MFISTALERLEVIINKPYKKHITTLTSSRRLETHNTQYQQASANEKNNNLTALTSTNCASQKNCPWQKITPLSELTWASQRFIHFVTKRGDEPFTKKKAGSAREVPEKPSSDGTITLKARPTFLCKHFGTPSRVNSVKARQTEHARALLA